MTCSISFTSGFFFWLPAIVLFSFVQINTFFLVCYLCAMHSKDTITENLSWPSHCCRRLQNELTGSICRGSHLKVDPALQLQVYLTSDWNSNNTFRCEKSCVPHIKIAFPVQNSSPTSIAWKQTLTQTMQGGTNQQNIHKRK
jgi:hypothetical protein